jgi:tight adherence protein C
MSEPAISMGLAAVGGAAAAAGVARAIGGRRAADARFRLHIRRVWWIPLVAFGALVPGRFVPLALAASVLVVAGRRLLAARAVAGRRRAADSEVPHLLDLVAAATSAGLSATAAFRAAVSSLRGPLGDELRASLDAVDLGGRWRPELTRATERLDLPELRRTIAILERTAALGTSLTDATRELASDVRQARRAAVAERARTAPVKMLFPLVFLILPAFLLLTVVPVLLTTVRSIG